jgi:aryl-alcohol dehydrogenase-like predicted oxidoreductase
MIRKRIVSTELIVSEVVFGTVDLGVRFSEEDSFCFLDAYADMGGNFIDTANFYGNWIPGLEISVCEKIVGRWLKSRGRRDIIVASKCAHPPDRQHMNIHRLHGKDIREDLENTLRNLHTSTVDLYYLLRDDESYPVENVIITLNEEIKKGKIRYIGASNWRPCRIKRANEFAMENGLQGFSANQMMWSLALPNWDIIPDPTLQAMDEECLDFHIENHYTIAAVPYSCMANGYFHKIGEGFDALHPKAKHRFVSLENYRRCGRLLEFSAKSGYSVSRIVMGYIMSQPIQTFPIIGFDSIDQLRDSIESASTRLTPEQISFLTGGRRI